MNLINPHTLDHNIHPDHAVLAFRRVTLPAQCLDGLAARGIIAGLGIASDPSQPMAIPGGINSLTVINVDFTATSALSEPFARGLIHEALECNGAHTVLMLHNVTNPGMRKLLNLVAADLGVDTDRFGCLTPL